MTDHTRALRLLLSRTPSGDERDALEAAIKRCELPVIETCNACPVGPESESGGEDWTCGHPEAPTALRGTLNHEGWNVPPVWCPLRNPA